MFGNLKEALTNVTNGAILLLGCNKFVIINIDSQDEKGFTVDIL